MNRVLLIAWLAFAPLAALAQDGVVNPQTDQSQLTRNKGQLPGTATNDSASAGNVGQLITSTCPTGNATITVTIASPAVVTYTAHGFSNVAPAFDACPIVFTNSGGALPTGITSGTTYYVVPSSITANTFQIATTVTNALSGASVNTSGSQSGTQTGTKGLALATTTAASATGVSLSAGDWDVSGTICFTIGASTTITELTSAVSTADNTFTVPPGVYSDIRYPNASTLANTGVAPCMTTPVVRYSVNATTSSFLIGYSIFATSTNTVYAAMRARRAR